jgi:hypothetical protein
VGGGGVGINWVTSQDLGLVGDLALEWDRFHCALIINGIQLSENPDQLIWMGGDESGVLTVKNAYEAVEKKKWGFVIGGWRKAICGPGPAH